MKNCFCISLRTGGILIAIYELILNIFFIFAFGLASRLRSKYEDPVAPKELHSNVTIASLEENQTTVEDNSASNDEFTTNDGIQLFYCVSQMIVSSLLIFGIIKKRPNFITVWLIYTTINIIIFTCTNIWSFSTGDYRPQYMAAKLVSLIIWLFFIKVIYDLRKEIKGESGEVTEVANV